MTGEEIRKDFAKAFDRVEYGFSLSSTLDWGFSNEDIKNLAILHRDDTEGKYRTKIEDLLEDCNFHTENEMLQNGEYDELINYGDKEDIE